MGFESKLLKKVTSKARVWAVLGFVGVIAANVLNATGVININSWVGPFTAAVTGMFLLAESAMKYPSVKRLNSIKGVINTGSWVVGLALLAATVAAIAGIGTGIVGTIAAYSAIMVVLQLFV